MNATLCVAADADSDTYFLILIGPPKVVSCMMCVVCVCVQCAYSMTVHFQFDNDSGRSAIYP